jgi:hypothetical protein
MEATIYVLKDPRTNEVRYVGCTRNIQQRYKAHINKARDLDTPKRKWITELRELGLKPILEELENIDESLSINKEKEYIKKFRLLGYNLVNTGELDNNGNSTSFQKGEKGIKIVALMLDGAYYNSYSSIISASIDTNTSSSNIASVLNKISKTAAKLIWVYEDDYYDLSDEDINDLVINAKDRSNVGGKSTQFNEGHVAWNKGKKGKLKPDKHVFQYSSITGLFIKEWTNAKQASVELKCNEEGIGQCCRGKSKTAGGYIWDYIKYEYITPPIYTGKTKQSIINNLK